jgi:hypothetical protein
MTTKQSHSRPTISQDLDGVFKLNMMSVLKEKPLILAERKI